MPAATAKTDAEAVKAALKRQQRMAAEAKAQREALAQARQRAEAAAAKAERERMTRQAETERDAQIAEQTERTAELARAQAIFDQQQGQTTRLAEVPPLPAPPTSLVPAPTQSVSSTPLSEPELALQIASRGGTDGGADKTADTAAEEPALMTSLARLSPAAGGGDSTLNGVGGADLSVAFSEGSGELSVDARNQLFELAQRLQEDRGVDVRLFGYADSLGEGPSRARRLSLSRLMTVRKFLIRQGIDMNSLDGRAMGEDPVAQNATDRVDIVIVRR